MKKLLVILLILILSTKTINAQTYENNISIDLTYTKYPSYTVKIPKSIDVTNNNSSFTYYVQADIYADQSIEILFDQTTTISNSVDTEILYIDQEKTIFPYIDLINQVQSSNVSIYHDDLTSGEWFGQLNVMISLIGE